jgi:three-Cys-motif partner protein
LWIDALPKAASWAGLALTFRRLSAESRQEDEMAVPIDVYPDSRDDLTVDEGQSKAGVGRWVPAKKHKWMANYLYGTRQAWKKWSQRAFIDPFCGPGRIRVKGEEFTRDGGALVAWRQSVKMGAPFTHVLIGDADEERARACEARLLDAGAPVQCFVGPAAETVTKMAANVPGRALCLAYIDPYNLEYLAFSILQSLAHLHVDFAVHYSTMDQVRNLEFEFNPKRARFDDTAPGWRENVEILKLNKAGAAEAFFEYWRGLVRSLNFTFSDEMPLVYNDSNHPIYRLAFFSRHPLPNRIWDDVVKDGQRGLDF